MINFQIRKVAPGDEIALIGLIQELAVYEKEPDAVKNTAQQLAIDLFEDNICDGFVAIINEQIVGMAIFYTSYSTWNGRCIYLEDLYVQPKHRGKGIGKALFLSVKSLAEEKKVQRMDWQVLDWNTPAIEFYKRLNATLDPTWVNGRFYFTTEK